MDGLALGIEQPFEVATDPALATGEEEAILGIHVCCMLAENWGIRAHSS